MKNYSNQDNTNVTHQISEIIRQRTPFLIECVNM